MSVEIKAVTANVTCQVSGAEGHLSAEVDTRQWGLNAGKSQFYEGDNVAVLVYVSKNVDIVGSFVAGGSNTKFEVPTNSGSPPKYQTTEIGFNLVREPISFTNPVANIAKPPTAEPTIIGSTFSKCAKPYFIPSTTYVVLEEWEPTLNPSIAPPYCHLFVQYTPAGVIGWFKGLGAPNRNDLASYVNTAVIFGVSRPMVIPYK